VTNQTQTQLTPNLFQAYDSIIRMTETVVDTKTRILDAAEKLFADKGFYATSLRDITAEAEVNLAAVNYHFQTKDSLIDAVIGRRVAPVNRRRLEMLAAAGSNPSVEQIVEAFVAPLLERDISPLLPMMGRVLATPDLVLFRLFKKHSAGVSEQFRKALESALPSLSASERMWRLLFMGGAMAHVLSWSHVIVEMSEGVCDPTDRKDVTARLVRFVAAGFRATEPPPPAQPPARQSEAA
jgi:AcrR family transcriptional regulator